MPPGHTDRGSHVKPLRGCAGRGPGWRTGSRKKLCVSGATWMVPAPVPFQLLGAALAPLDIHVVTLQASAMTAAEQGAN